MTSRTTATAPSGIRSATLLERLLARPLLTLSLAIFRREVRRARQPRDDEHRPAMTDSPDRLLFLSDISGSGYGVVTHGLATPARTTRLVSEARLQACEYDSVSDPAMTASQAADAVEARRPAADSGDMRPCGTEVAFVLIGVTDALRMTSTDSWSTSLARIATGMRCPDGQCGVVFAAVPPLHDFWPIRRPLRQIIERRVDVLNAATRDVVARTPGTNYSPFPVWTEADVEVGRLFSWKAMHEVRARALAPLALGALAPAGSFGL